MSLHVLLVLLRMFQTQTVETLSADTERQVPLSTEGFKRVHTHLVLQLLYNRKPMQRVQDWCNIFSFMSRVSNLAEEFCTFCSCVSSGLEDHTGERCHNLAEMLSGICRLAGYGELTEVYRAVCDYSNGSSTA